MKREPCGCGSKTSSGFTLLEVLLAFVVFALSFSLVLEIITSSMRSTTRARTYTEAALLGQSIMEMVGKEIPLQEGVLAGEAPGGYTWEMSVFYYLPEFENDRTVELAAETGVALFQVELNVAWETASRPRTIKFTTIRSLLENRVG